MSRRIFVCAFFVLLFVLPRAAEAYPKVCVPANGSGSFQFNSSAVNENSVTIVRIPDHHVEARFNNYAGRGAGSEWTQQYGWVHLAPLDFQTCYRIEGRNKADRPNAALPWRDSAARPYPNGGVYFEDGTDNDFNDAIVDVQVRGPGAFSGAKVCAPQGAVMWIEVSFMFPPATQIFIMRARDLHIVRTFTSTLPPGGFILAGGNALYGAGTYTTRPADGPCFVVTGQTHTGPGASDLINTPKQSNGDTMLLDPNRDGQFGEAKVVVSYALDPIVSP